MLAEKNEQLLAHVRNRHLRRRSPIGCRSRALPIRLRTTGLPVIRRRRRHRGSKVEALAQIDRCRPMTYAEKEEMHGALPVHDHWNVWLVVTK